LISLLELITDDESVRMEWKHYWRNIVKRYQVIIEGWPDNIPFRNLSDTSSPVSDLEDLLRRWRSGSTYWKKLTAREVQALDQERDKQISNGEVDVPVPRRRRSDYGKKRPRTKQSDENNIRKKHKSKEILDSSDSESGSENTPSAPATSSTSVPETLAPAISSTSTASAPETLA
jgi:hypothetical protein